MSVISTPHGDILHVADYSDRWHGDAFYTRHQRDGNGLYLWQRERWQVHPSRGEAEDWLKKTTDQLPMVVDGVELRPPTEEENLAKVR